MTFLASGTFPSESAGGRPLTWAATSRMGGVSAPPYAELNLAAHVGDDPQAVQRNLQTVSRRMGAAGIAVMSARHGGEVGTVEAPGTVDGVDALVTRVPGLAIAALGADCLVLGLASLDRQAIAVVHCGWRGLAADVVGAAVSSLGGAGIAAVLGPAICGPCYAVPPERISEVRDSCPPDVATAAVTTSADGQPAIDVRAGVAARLRQLGVNRIESLDVCTAEDPRLFSYRRDGVTGRQAMVCVIDGEPMSSSAT